jgi:hypothetical protein
MTMTKIPNLRKIKKKMFWEITVLEGDGDDRNPYREVSYFIDEDGLVKFISDPSGILS